MRAKRVSRARPATARGGSRSRRRGAATDAGGAGREEEKLTAADKRYWLGRFLDQRDGHKCALLDASCRGALVIDHVNGNRDDWSEENLRWLCLSHNRRERDRRVGSGATVTKVSEGENGAREPGEVKRHVDYQAGSEEMAANELMEVPFLNWLEGRVRQAEQDREGPTAGAHRVLKSDAMNAGARYMDGSPSTSRKYLDKATSTEGPYKVVKNAWKEKVVVRRPPEEHGALAGDEAP